MNIRLKLGTALFASAALAAGCASMNTTASAGADSAPALQDGSRNAPIRVLMLTATQGPRNDSAIQASKQVMEQLARSSELQVDVSEDVNDLNPQKLAAYDVLFLANSTLRDTPPDTTAPVQGTVFDIKRRGVKGVLTIVGEPGSQSGTLVMEGRPDTTALGDVSLSDSELSFTTPVRGPAGAAATGMPWTAKIQGDALDGSVTSRGSSMAWTGTRRPAAVRRAYVPVSDAQQQAILDFAHAGKGVVVAHAGLDALYQSKGYREMVGGGLLQEHPWTQTVRVNVEDKQNPADARFGDSFSINDEIYVLDQDPRWNSHVLLSLDMPSVGVTTGDADATVDDYPISWIRPYGQGRVFVTTLGGSADVWHNADFQQHLLQGMREAAGRLPTGDIAGHRTKETVASDVWPDDIALDDEGNVWIAELTGRVLRYDHETRQTQVVAEIPTTDPTNNEHGILGVEVDPDFYSGQPWVYIFHTERESFINTLSRYRYQDGKIDLSTEQVLLRVPTETNCCHQAGDLEWGPDKTLFISAGDNSSSSTRPEDEISAERVAAFEQRNNLDGHSYSRQADSERSSQNLQDLRGKVLRINRDGTIPKDNPFFGQPGVRWEIWAYGLRNPYRFKYDSTTNRLFIGIVGPDEQTTYDWFDISKGGENFGWPRANGRDLYNEWTPSEIPNYAPSAWEYTYADGSRTAMAGPVYRSTGKYAFPQLQGKYLMFDQSRKWIKYGDLVDGTWTSDTSVSNRKDGKQFAIPTKRLTNIKTFELLTDTSPISMDVGPDGCIYVDEFDGYWRPGPDHKSKVSRYCWVNGSTTSVEGPADTR